MEKYKVGDVVEGKVTGIEQYGIFLSLSEKVSGLIHISEISYSFVKDPGDYAKVGDTMRAKIISDDGKGHYKLSIKQLYEGSSKVSAPKIVETNSGFQTLSKKLEEWIQDYYTK